jgi:protoheme IX farnesyltransferase
LNQIMTGRTHEIDTEATWEGGMGSAADFFELLKPRVMSLVIFTATVGMVIAPGNLHPILAIVSLLCIAVGAGASGALNMWIDADIDAIMTRTASRPIPSGRVTRDEALAFGTILAVGAVMVLGLAANWLAASLLAFTILFYVVVYSIWLKRLTPQNIVIGGAAGALPPVVAWAAATGSVSLPGIILFLIIFIWTPPQFWALALFKSEDYRRAGIPMMPVVAGDRSTRNQILAYAVALAPIGCLPYVFGFGGLFYVVLSAALGLGFVGLAVAVRRAGAQDPGQRAAKRLFAFSIVYLFLLFAALLVEHIFAFAGWI